MIASDTAGHDCTPRACAALKTTPTRRPTRAIAGLTGATVTAALLCSAITGGPAGAAPSSGGVAFGANAFGARVSLGSLAHVGRLAYSPLCTRRAGVTHTNKAARLTVGAVGYVGAVTSRAHSTKHGATSSSIATSRTARTALVGGLISLDALSSTASVSHSPSGFGTRGTSVFVGLTVAGKHYPADVPANSHYDILGLGALTLNQQQTSLQNGLKTITVTAFNLVLNQNNLAGLPGGRIVLGRSTATMLLANRLPSGLAYATSASVPSIAGSGPTAAVSTPCGGTGNGTYRSDATGSVLPDGISRLAAAHSSVRSTDSPARTTMTSRDEIARVRLLNGMITARAVRTQANATAASGRHALSDAGTAIVDLVVAGRSIGSPAPGTTLVLAGLGTLYFGYTQRTATGITVNGIRLVLGTAKDGLPAGAIVTIGYASSNVAG